MSADTIGLLTSTDDDEEISFGARKLTSKGRRAEEKEFGADILIAVNINVLDYKGEKRYSCPGEEIGYGQVH